MSDPIVETPLAVGALGIVRRFVNAGKDDLTFQIAVDSTADCNTIFDVMDTISAVAERETLKAEVAERKKALEISKNQPAEMLKGIEVLKANRMAYLGTRDAARARSNRRLPQEPSEKEKQELDQHDKLIEQAILSRKQFMEDMPITEWQIACMEARIARQPEPPKPPELERRLAELRLVA